MALSDVEHDFTLRVTVRVYGDGTAYEAARALLTHECQGLYMTPGGDEVEFISVVPVED